MKQSISFIFIVLAASFALSCYKDLGNYSYKVPPAPVVAGLDSLYSTVLGDTLIVAPTVTIAESHPRLGFQWTIAVPAGDSGVNFTGPKLQYVFGLPPGTYNVLLTIVDSTDSMHYFYPFAVSGVTAYVKGTVILSLENGISQLSFVDTLGNMQPRIYRALNGEDLPAGPMQVIPMADQNIVPTETSSYWIICGGGPDPGVQLDANTLLPIKTLKGNFFSAPASLIPGTLYGSSSGTMQGVISGKLYWGTNQTWNQAPVYGMFGQAPPGNYALYHQVACNGTFPYFLGYDSVKKQFVVFTNFGGPAYVGTNYPVTDSTAFSPITAGLDMLDFEQINDQNCYAFGTANDTLYELKFGTAFVGNVQFSPQYKRPFIRPDLITPTTKWASSPAEVFYFSSGSTIYSYNPLNQAVTPLSTSFNGQAITMVKVADGGNTLITGVDGTVYFLDISTGHNGQLIKQINNVPGSPVDVTVRTY
ncbi:MAG TPA: PKD-like family lipoprotein [Puia sp.]|nr:PKD-like family lipoprotein [Puia sp.]